MTKREIKMGMRKIQAQKNMILLKIMITKKLKLAFKEFIFLTPTISPVRVFPFINDKECK